MDEKIIRDAQYRKGLSIAFFNANNSAISLVANRQIADRNELLKLVTEYRDFFLEEHKKYYATVIANIGANYKVEDSIARLKATKTLDELKTTWISLSADERKDPEIIKVAQELKKLYEKA